MDTCETHLETRLRLFPVDAVEEGSAKRFVDGQGHAYAIYNLGAEFFVTDDLCTHGMASLSEGFLEGDRIECPWHGGAFNVRTGEPLAHPCVTPIRVYEVYVEDGVIWISLKSRGQRSAIVSQPEMPPRGTK